MSDVVVPCDVNATRPLSDKKDYRLIILPCGLRAMLISEPEGLHGPSNSGGHTKPADEADMEDDEMTGGDGACANGKASERSDCVDEDEAVDEAEGGSKHRKNAAIALAVAVGSWEDPPHVQGLAHFLEHMLFMGSEKYPQENALDSYLSEHGGSTNAHTEREYTCYEVDVLPDFLSGALDRYDS
jgi:nardilysin